VPELTASRRPARQIGQALLLAAAYFAAAKLALLIAIPPGYATPVWPPSGIALAAMLLVGGRVWPGVWLGATLVNLTVETSLAAALMIGTGNTLEAVAGAALIRRFCGDFRCFERGEEVLGFVAAAGLSGTIAATVAMISLATGHELTSSQLLSNWWTWWQGDVSGMIIVTPLILSWSTRSKVVWSRQKIAEAISFALLLLVVAHVAFRLDPGAASLSPLMFLIVPFIIWAAFRFGQREVTTATAVACSLAIWDVFERSYGVAHLNESLLLLLAFNSTVVATGLVLGAVLTERDRVMQAIRGHRDELEVRVEQRTQELAVANQTLQNDMKERARMETLVVESERRFRSMIEAVQDYAILLLDTEGRVTSWNRGAERIKGYTAEEIIGRPFMCFYCPEDIAAGRPQRALELAARDGRFENEGWQVRKDGSRFWANAIITALRDETGRLRGFAKVTRNLARQKETEEALRDAMAAAEKASQAKSEFLARMSHELRTPLNSLLILAKLLADNASGNLQPKQVQFARSIHDAGMDLLNLINDILDLSRIESGAVTHLEIGPVRFSRLRDYLESNFQQVAQSKGLAFSITIDERLPAAMETDERRLQQILKNLLSNAFKFTREGGVSLHIAPPVAGGSAVQPDAAHRAVAFSVTDTGIGIPPDKLEVIFEAFQQADGTTSRQFGGTGLGLAISRELIRLLGGEIRVESEAGRGSTFTACLPLQPQAANSELQAASSAG
jgi:PAS domain S-box-containing protein